MSWNPTNYSIYNGLIFLSFFRTEFVSEELQTDKQILGFYKDYKIIQYSLAANNFALRLKNVRYSELLQFKYTNISYCVIMFYKNK